MKNNTISPQPTTHNQTHNPEPITHPLSLYLHIPFCKKKCNYCDFVSFAGKENLIDDYVNTLCDEITFQLTTYNLPFTTVYFGGGTPTLLKPEHFKQILSAISSHYLPCRQAGALPITRLEISIEANPGTVNEKYLAELRKFGINRISIGAQSFNNQHLKYLGRIHNEQDIFNAVKDAKAAGFKNINLDLMFCLPNQTMEEWKDDLSKALSLNPTHLSTYNLQFEKNTPLYKDKDKDKDKNEDREDLDADMFEYTIKTLKENGFDHYEISNFAKPGFECQHNIIYWKNGDYLGVGCGAHSHLNGERWENTSSLNDYILKKKVSSKQIADTRKETIFMGLRLLDGIGQNKFAGFEKEVDDLIGQGLLEKSGNNIKLTGKGLMLANIVFERFI